MNEIKSYSKEDYVKAKQQGLDLDIWSDYSEFYNLDNNSACEDII